MIESRNISPTLLELKYKYCGVTIDIGILDRVSALLLLNTLREDVDELEERVEEMPLEEI